MCGCASLSEAHLRSASLEYASETLEESPIWAFTTLSSCLWQGGLEESEGSVTSVLGYKGCGRDGLQRQHPLPQHRASALARVHHHVVLQAPLRRCLDCSVTASSGSSSFEDADTSRTLLPAHAGELILSEQLQLARLVQCESMQRPCIVFPMTTQLGCHTNDKRIFCMQRGALVNVTTTAVRHGAARLAL